MISWILFGLIVGAIARLLYPGSQDLGLLKTMLLGIAGSFVGGLIGWMVSGGSIVQASGWIGSIFGSVIVLAIAAHRKNVTAS